MIFQGGMSRTHDSLTWFTLRRSSRDIAPLPDEDPVGIASESELRGSVAVWGQVGAVGSRSREIAILDQSALAYKDHPGLCKDKKVGLLRVHAHGGSGGRRPVSVDTVK